MPNLSSQVVPVSSSSSIWPSPSLSTPSNHISPGSSIPRSIPSSIDPSPSLSTPSIGIVESLNFFDPEVYSEDVDDLDQTKEEEGDPSEFEKKKDHYNIYENELLPEDKTDENIKEYSQFEGLNDEWEDFNERDFENSSS